MHKATELIQKSVDQKGHTVFLHEKGLLSLQRANRCMVSFRYHEALLYICKIVENNADQALLEIRTLGSWLLFCVFVLLPVLAVSVASPTAVSTPSAAEFASAPEDNDLLHCCSPCHFA